MATVIVTFFLIVRFYVCKMDADSLLALRKENSHRRVKRWSMNSQRLEEIVTALMKPVSDIRETFDTDLCALLEEYLTEAGLRALDNDDNSTGEENSAIPNFVELAMLLQHFTTVYGQKVDYLYQHVLQVSDSLSCSLGEAVNNVEEVQTPSSRVRKRKASAINDFVAIDLEEYPGSRRELEVSRPPPTLPRLFLQLEPRVPTAYDAQLIDYEGEPIGMLADLNVTWRLQNGFLVDDLAEAPIEDNLMGATPRPLSLTELQSEFDNGAPPDSPPRCSTPFPVASTNSDLDGEHENPRPMEMLDLSPILDEPARKKLRKKRIMSLEDIVGISVTLVINEEQMRRTSKRQEFALPEKWISRVMDKRKKRALVARQELLAHEPRPPNLDIRGMFDSRDIEGFHGWTQEEIAASALAARRPDDEDDGFFEHSFPESGSDDTPMQNDSSPTVVVPQEWECWRAEVLRRAALQEGRTVDIQASACTLLKHVQHAQHEGQNHERATHDLVPCDRLLSVAKDQIDVSKFFFATLFLANAGNIEVVQGEPLTLNSFSVRLLSADERLYRTAMPSSDEQTPR